MTGATTQIRRPVRGVSGRAGTIGRRPVTAVTRGTCTSALATCTLSTAAIGVGDSQSAVSLSRSAFLSPLAPLPQSSLSNPKKKPLSLKNLKSTENIETYSTIFSTIFYSTEKISIRGMSILTPSLYPCYFSPQTALFRF